jgi:methyl-accepting chemotaxis protein
MTASSRQNLLANLPFLWKVSLAPALVLVVLIAMSAYAYVNLMRTSTAIDKFVNERLTTQHKLTDIDVSFANYERDLFRTITDFGGTQDAAKLATQKQRLTTQLTGVTGKLAAYKKATSATTGAQFKAIDDSLQKYNEAASAVFDMLEIDFAGAVGFVKPLAAHGQIVEQSLSVLITNGNKQIAADINQMQADLESQRTWFMWSVVGAIFAVMALAWSIARAICKSIVLVADVTGRVASGHVDVDLTQYQRGDELNLVIAALGKFKETMAARDQLETEKTEQRLKADAEAEERRREERREIEREAEREHQRQQQRRSLREQLAKDFDTAVTSTIRALQQRSNLLEKSSSALKERARKNQSLSNDLAVNANTVMTDMDTAAAATEELSVSVAEISDRIKQSSNSVMQISERAALAKPVVAELAVAANRIGDIVNVINEIAAQTNLLALNATIEAARAGEAGRGFSVVANEVKALATQTAKSTQEISLQIQEMQHISTNVVEAIEAIALSIATVSGSATQAAAALIQQNTATSEIACNVMKSSSQMTQMTSGAEMLINSAQENEAAAQELAQIISELRDQCDSLKIASEHFSSRILAA